MELKQFLNMLERCSRLVVTDLTEVRAEYQAVSPLNDAEDILNFLSEMQDLGYVMELDEDEGTLIDIDTILLGNDLEP
jgi:hypothetical protein